MRSVIFIVLVLLLPFAAAANPPQASADDPVSDESAIQTFGVAVPHFVDCSAPTADITHVDMSAAGGQLKVTITVSDLANNKVSCPFFSSMTIPSALWEASFTPFDATTGVNAGDSIRVGLQRNDGEYTSCGGVTWSDQSTSNCVPIDFVIAANSVTLSMPSTGFAIDSTTGAERAYDVHGDTIGAFADTQAIIPSVTVFGIWTGFTSVTDSVSLPNLSS